MQSPTLQVEYINPFVSAAFSVLQSAVSETPIKGQPSAYPASFVGQQLSVMCGISGSVTGIVIFGMSMMTADRIVAKMGDQNLRVFNDAAASVIAELARLITGQSLMKLSEAGFTCDATPPTLIRGSQVEISTFCSPSITVPLNTSLGALHITIALRDKASLLKAA